MTITANNKIILIAVAASVAAAAATVGALRYFESPREIVIRDGATARYANFDDFVLSGRLQRNFVSSAPTNFIAGAEVITPSVVNIKALTTGSGDNFWNDGAPGAS